MNEIYSDIFFCNKDMPKRFWSDADINEYSKLDYQRKEAIQKFRKKNQKNKDYNSWIKWYDKEEQKIAKPYLDKMLEIQNKTNLYDKNDIDLIIKMFSNKYDLTDVRVFLIVKEFLQNYMINSRMQKQLMKNNITLEVYDKNDNVHSIPHPLLNTKLQYSKMYIDTIEKLDKITKEDKVIDYVISDESKFYSKILSKIDNNKIIDIK